MSTQPGKIKPKSLKQKRLDIQATLNEGPDDGEKKKLFEEANSILAAMNARKQELQGKILAIEERIKNSDTVIANMNKNIDKKSSQITENKHEISRILGKYESEIALLTGKTGGQVTPGRPETIAEKTNCEREKARYIALQDANATLTKNTDHSGEKITKKQRTIEELKKAKEKINGNIFSLENESEKFKNALNKPAIEQLYKQETSLFQKFIDFFKAPSTEDMKKYLTQKDVKLPDSDFTITEKSILNANANKQGDPFTDLKPRDDTKKTANVDITFAVAKSNYNNNAISYNANDAGKISPQAVPTTFSAASTSQKQTKLSDIAKPNPNQPPTPKVQEEPVKHRPNAPGRRTDAP